MIGALAPNVWSVAGDDDAPDVNAFTLQYFVHYNMDDGWYVPTSPINAFVSKLTTIGSQKVQFQVGGRYWAESPRGGPDDFGASVKVTFLFPR